MWLLTWMLAVDRRKSNDNNNNKLSDDDDDDVNESKCSTQRQILIAISVGEDIDTGSRRQ